MGDVLLSLNEQRVSTLLTDNHDRYSPSGSAPSCCIAVRKRSWPSLSPNHRKSSIARSLIDTVQGMRRGSLSLLAFIIRPEFWSCAAGLEPAHGGRHSRSGVSWPLSGPQFFGPGSAEAGPPRRRLLGIQEEEAVVSWIPGFLRELLHATGQRQDLLAGVALGLPVSEHARQGGDLCDPTAVVFVLVSNLKFWAAHESAGRIPLHRLRPQSSNLRPRQFSVTAMVPSAKVVGGTAMPPAAVSSGKIIEGPTGPLTTRTGFDAFAVFTSKISRYTCVAWETSRVRGSGFHPVTWVGILVNARRRRQQ